MVLGLEAEPPNSCIRPSLREDEHAKLIKAAETLSLAVFEQHQPEKKRQDQNPTSCRRMGLEDPHQIAPSSDLLNP